MKSYYQDKPEVIRQYIDQQTCWICGKGGWKALSQHLVKAHGLPAVEVRELAYMFKTERLISVELSEKLSKVTLAKFGDNRYGYKRGVPQPKRVFSQKQKDILFRRISEIQSLTKETQRRKRKPHYCRICGAFIETSRPQYCSRCVHTAWSKSAKKHMTPERIAFFKTVLYKPTPAEQSATARKMWEGIKSWPIEKQKTFFLKRAESRKAPLIEVNCVMCGTPFLIPDYRLHGKRRTTCSMECSKALMAKRGREQIQTDSKKAKLSALAIKRHINEPLFGRCSQEVMELKI